jgi:DNA invertase Pin-like site-specific DNA recombinase
VITTRVPFAFPRVRSRTGGVSALILLSHVVERPTRTKKPPETDVVDFGAWGGDMRAAIYLRVSTDEQTTENQERELRATAERAGHEVVAVYRDAGISGAKGRVNRPGFDTMNKDAARRRFDVVMAWSVDRLGRSLQDLIAFMQELRSLKIDLCLHQQGLDTTTPAGKAMFQMMGVIAEFERTLIQERVRAGMARAKREGKHVGRPPIAPELEQRIREALVVPGRPGVRVIARQFGVNPGTVQRIARPFEASVVAGLG